MCVCVRKCTTKFLLMLCLKSYEERKEKKETAHDDPILARVTVYRVMYFFVITIVFIRRNRSIASPFRIVLE